MGYKCALLSSSSWVAKLYDVSPSGVDACCDTLTGVNPTYCRAKTMAVPSGMWYVSYADEKCRKDCDDVGDPSCQLSSDAYTSYFDTHDKCCQNRLPYIVQSKCQADSLGEAYFGTRKYSVDYASSKCSQDCPIKDGGDCSGVVGRSSVKLFNSTGACCDEALSYLNRDLCVDRSDSTSTGTGKYYKGSDDDGEMCGE